MKRIMVLGVSAGTGKSTLARQMGESLGLDVFHLDRMFWKPGWIESTQEEFAAKQQEVVQRDAWIIEGNYSGTYDLRAKRADTIVYVELPLYICLYRVINRWWHNRGQTREDMGEGCEEKLDYEFLKFIVTTYHRRKKRMRERFRAFQQEDITKEIVLLRSREDVARFLESLKA
ncbi:topology modulation protein [Halobacillus locisalis]|uniref:Topology modulation protein n=1 Tax=Halobacillus locisalis TaxID=220753 RepID=A0A838CYC8_9BACI|nr:topology modulation protein [Halobacillus locisalis]MBA2176586.1 topology modulation protein [Halobacillus locisalis]